MEQLMQLIEKFPDDLFSRHALAMEYIKMGMDVKALELMQGLLEQSPNHVGTYYHLGKLHERMGELQQALRVYEDGEVMARSLNATHELRELTAAKENVLDQMDE